MIWLGSYVFLGKGLQDPCRCRPAAAPALKNARPFVQPAAADCRTSGLDVAKGAARFEGVFFRLGERVFGSLRGVF